MAGFSRHFPEYIMTRTINIPKVVARGNTSKLLPRVTGHDHIITSVIERLDFKGMGIFPQSRPLSKSQSSMRLINIKLFVKREQAIGQGKSVSRRTKVLDFCDDERTAYAILSHRWIEKGGETSEVGYDEIVELGNMDKDRQNEVRGRSGYRKILKSCEQAMKDGYEWLWADTCCIDKRSSAELSEAINSMYRWYENSRVCYAYLHDVPSGSSFPTECDYWRYHESNGWPEWFSRGWTLQEMTAPTDVQFFNEVWKPIGNRRTLAHVLAKITRVPWNILTDGLSSHRPCVAQILSWAADRTTTRVEDRAYSLMGLLDVNMPMLYGEGKRAFQRLQLEIIRVSNDQSIFAWDPIETTQRTGSILAPDPNSFRNCAEMELIDIGEFIRSLKADISEEVEEDRFSAFPITNRGIQIWLLVRPCVDSSSVFEALLPCRSRPRESPVPIKLASWKSNYYRYSVPPQKISPEKKSLELQQLYLRYQDTPQRNVTFNVNDSMITANGFTYCGLYPSKLTGNTHTLTGNDLPFLRVYVDREVNCRFAVGFGQCFGQDWMHCVYEKCTSPRSWGSAVLSWEDYAEEEYKNMLARGPEHAQTMADARSRGERYRLCVTQSRLPRSSWTVRTSCMLWESSRNRGVSIEIFQDVGFLDGSKGWRSLDVEVGRSFLGTLSL